MTEVVADGKVDPVLRIFAAWNAHDADALKRVVWPDASVHATLAGTERRFEGPRGALAWANEIQIEQAPCELVADHIKATTERVVVLGSVRCRGAAAQMTQPASWIFHLREGKVDELRIHVPPGEVLAAAGLGS
jgi:ketosteroid isomerase-like protein